MYPDRDSDPSRSRSRIRIQIHWGKKKKTRKASIQTLNRMFKCIGKCVGNNATQLEMFRYCEAGFGSMLVLLKDPDSTILEQEKKG